MTEDTSGIAFAFLLLRALSFGGFVLAAVYFLASLSRAFFHESTVLYNRRHALRFGRLAVYLEDGSPDRDILERIFRWNEEFSSAFKDIKPEAMRDVGIGKLASLPPETLKAVADIALAAGELKKQSATKTTPA